MKNMIAEMLNRVSPFTQRLLIFAIINLMILSILKGDRKFLDTTRSFLGYSYQTGDSWVPMFKALDYLRTNPETPIYSQIFFLDRIKFQYPLTSLLPLKLLERVTSHRETQIEILQFLSWCAVLLTIFYTIRIFNHYVHFNDCLAGFADSKTDRIVRVLVLVVLGLMFYPIMKAYALGQVQVFINCFLTLAVWSWIRRKEGRSGVLIGLVILLKPQYLLIAAWGIARKKYSFATSLLLIVLSGLLVSLIMFGRSHVLDYFNVLRFISRTGECFYPNQSMNGLLNRLLFNGDNIQWDPHGFAPYHPFVYAGTLVSSAMIILCAFLLVKQSRRGGVSDFLIMSLSCTMASPIAWEHHYGILLVIFAFLFTHLVAGLISFKVRYMYFFVLAYFLGSNFLPQIDRIAEIPLLNVAQSYLYFSGLIGLALLYGVRCDSPSPPAPLSKDDANRNGHSMECGIDRSMRC